MHILAANLKQICQKNNILFWQLPFLLFALLILFIFKSGNVSLGLAILWIWMFLFALLPNALVIKILMMPFSFCLPEHHYIPRKQAFVSAAIIALLWSLLLLKFFEIRPLYPSVFASFTILFTAYLLSAWPYFRFGFQFSYIPFTAMLLILITGCRYFNLHLVPYYIVSQCPFIVIIAGIGANFLIWKYWGNARAIHRLHEMINSTWGIIDFFKGAKSDSVDIQKKKSQSRTGLIIEAFLFRRISKGSVNSISKYIWGAFYRPHVILMVSWFDRLTLIWLIPSFALFGYLGSFNQLPWLYFFCFYFNPLDKPILNSIIFSPQVYTGGRRERFYAAIALTLGNCFLFSNIILLLVAASWICSGILPPIKELEFAPISIFLIVVPWFIIPLTEGMYLFFARKLNYTWCRGLIFLLLISVTIPFLERENPPGPILLLTAVLIGWAFFVRVLWTTTRDDCLV